SCRRHSTGAMVVFPCGISSRPRCAVQRALTSRLWEIAWSSSTSSGVEKVLSGASSAEIGRPTRSTGKDLSCGRTVRSAAGPAGDGTCSDIDGLARLGEESSASLRHRGGRVQSLHAQGDGRTLLGEPSSSPPLEARFPLLEERGGALGLVVGREQQ